MFRKYIIKSVTPPLDKYVYKELLCSKIIEEIIKHKPKSGQNSLTTVRFLLVLHLDTLRWRKTGTCSGQRMWESS